MGSSHWYMAVSCLARLHVQYVLTPSPHILTTVPLLVRKRSFVLNEEKMLLPLFAEGERMSKAYLSVMYSCHLVYILCIHVQPFHLPLRHRMMHVSGHCLAPAGRLRSPGGARPPPGSYITPTREAVICPGRLNVGGCFKPYSVHCV